MRKADGQAPTGDLQRLWRTQTGDCEASPQSQRAQARACSARAELRHIHRKATLTGSLLTAVCLFLFACSGPAPKKISPKGQIISISDSVLCAGGADTIRFGRLGSGETAVKPLLLYNASQKPIVVTTYTRTCGCTTFEYDSQPLMSGDTVPARLIFDSRGLVGWQFKLIEIELAGSSAPLKLYIDAEVE